MRYTLYFFTHKVYIGRIDKQPVYLIHWCVDLLAILLSVKPLQQTARHCWWALINWSMLTYSDIKFKFCQVLCHHSGNETRDNCVPGVQKALSNDWVTARFHPIGQTALWLFSGCVSSSLFNAVFKTWTWQGLIWICHMKSNLWTKPGASGRCVLDCKSE